MPQTKAKQILLGVAVATVVASIGCASMFVCLPAWLFDGIVVGTCPAGELRQTLDVSVDGLRRDRPGSVTVSATAHYTTGPADADEWATVRRLDADLSLVDAAGTETALEPDDGWDDVGDGIRAEVELPEVPDGDYMLRVRVDSAVSDTTQDVPLAVYAPARIHVLTDRPLYEPGNTVRFRAAVLRARDLSPIDGRPGRWVVTDPTGEVLLDEKAPAGDWGVVAGSFPLDTEAESGTWRVAWVSGADQDEITFQVEPFTLPRFSIEASADRPWYRAGDRPTVEGRVVYSSGAPVADASVEISWTTDGEWPLPTDWTGGGATGLPTEARTDAAGRFVLRLPEIPADLRDTVRLGARLSATDPAGDRVTGGASVLLSEDGIAVQSVTELGSGLVEGFNSRVFLRVATPSGTPLGGAKVTVKRAWDPRDAGITADADADGVAAIQLDPGPAVNVVIPPMPVRPPPPVPAARIRAVRELLRGREPTLAERRALDSWLAGIEPCAWLVQGEVAVTVGVHVAADGRVLSATPGGAGGSACVAGALSGRRMPPGEPRVFALGWTLTDANLPALRWSKLDGEHADTPDELDDALGRARACLPQDVRSGTLPRALLWRSTKDSARLSLSWLPDPRGDGALAGVASCIERSVGATTLEEPAIEDEQGLLRLSTTEASRLQLARPQATTRLGYELAIAAAVDGEPVGETTLVMDPGAVPDVRLRATPTTPKPGDEVVVEILRGPDFRGDLPEKLWLRHALRDAIEAKVDEKARTATFALPDDADGWFEVSWSGARAMVFVRPRDELSVAVTPDRERYAPGDEAVLRLQTTTGGAGAPAAVGLVGIDATMGQLAPLPGADDMDRLRPPVETPSPAFEILDGAALTMGRIQGVNAAAATVLRVSTIPSPADLDTTIYTSASGSFDPIADLTDHFYTVLAELHGQTRTWERSAPPDEQMSPQGMARLWKSSLKACQKRDEDVTDAYGRPLRLGVLPPDLLELTAPHAVVVDGTRLPEDVENWATWVAEENP